MKSPLELFRRLERDIRSPKERLPIDAFLPSPETYPTEFPDPPPPQLAAQVRELGGPGDEEERRERHRQRRGRKPAAAPEGKTPPKKLEDEIQEFINRDQPEGAEEEDLSQFLGGFDPSEIPEK